MSNWGGVLFTDSTLGFTLIELLAVIVILAVIALIATPIVLNIIEQARYGAAKSSAIGYVEASEKGVILYLMENKNNKITGDCTTKNNVLTCGSIPLTLDVKGSLPSSGTIVFDSKGNVEEVTALVVSGYKFSYKDGKWTGEKDSGGEVEPPTPETGIPAKTSDIGKYVTYTPTNANWNTTTDGVSETNDTNQGKFNIYYRKSSGSKSVNGEPKSNSITCYDSYTSSIGDADNKNSGWRIMNVSSSGQITLIHAGTPECYYHASGQSAASKTILRVEATSTSNEGTGKAWTKYGSSLAQSVHYMTEADYNTILKNKNGNENYYLWDYLDKNDRGTCYAKSQTECGKDYDLIDTGSWYWLASANGSNALYFWDPSRQGVYDFSSNSYGVRPVIVLKSTVKIKSGQGSNTDPYNLTT